MQNNSISNAVLRSRTLRWWEMSDAWLCTLTPSSAERAQAGRWPSQENHHLVFTNRVPSCSFLTCSHLSARIITPTLRRSPNQACMFPRPQPSCGSGQVLFPSEDSQRLSVYYVTVRGLNCPSVHCQTWTKPSHSFKLVDVRCIAVVLELLFLLLMDFFFIKLLLWFDSLETSLELNSH